MGDVVFAALLDTLNSSSGLHISRSQKEETGEPALGLRYIRSLPGHGLSWLALVLWLW